MTTGAATRLWALDGAKFTLDRGLLVVGGTGSIHIPVPTYLIQHPRGLVLVDTGIAPEAIEDPEGTYGELASLIGLEYTADLRVDKQLEAVGFKTDDIDHVVVSHSHFDHTGAIKLFPNARFYIGAADLPYAYWPMPAASVYFRTADIDPARGFDWHPLTGDLDLFGDGSIQILSMPGHTPGNSSVLVRLPNQNVMLTCDTVHVPEALSDDLPMPSDYSTLDLSGMASPGDQLDRASPEQLERARGELVGLQARSGTTRASVAGTGCTAGWACQSRSWPNGTGCPGAWCGTGSARRWSAGVRGRTAP